MLDRVAGAPISWGVCEVPGWGQELPPERVLAEMRELGLAATEFGPVGYLGREAEEVVALLERHGLALVGGFLPIVLDDPMEVARRTAELYAACGGRFLVTAIVLDAAWSPPRPLSQTEWGHLVDALARLDELAAEHGLEHVLHPHVGTLIERADDVRRVLDSSDVRLCLDTGHMAIGGLDPAALVAEVPERIGHVHLKDVRMEVAQRLRAGELSLVEAVRAGLFAPLGDGDVRVAEVVSALEGAGYDGWLTIEQDVTLGETPPPGSGPIDDVRRSVEFLQSETRKERVR